MLLFRLLFDFASASPGRPSVQRRRTAESRVDVDRVNRSKFKAARRSLKSRRVRNENRVRETGDDQRY